MDVVINKTSCKNISQGISTPPDTYRGPVSSPAAVLQPPFPFAKSQLDFLTDRPSPVQRSETYRSKQKHVGKLSSLRTPRSRNFHHYYVNNRAETNFDKQNTGPWVNSLCAQPVDEIFSKYKRQFEIQRMKQLWTKTSTTLGEKDLLDAWMKNNSKKSENRTVESHNAKSSASISLKSGRKSGDKGIVNQVVDTRMSPPLHNTPESDRYNPDFIHSNPSPPVPQPTAIEIPQDRTKPRTDEKEKEKEQTELCDEKKTNKNQNKSNMIEGGDYYDQYKRQVARFQHVKSNRVKVHTANWYMSGEEMFPPVSDSKLVTETRPFSPAKQFRYKLIGKSPILHVSQQIPEKLHAGDIKLPYFLGKG